MIYVILKENVRCIAFLYLVIRILNDVFDVGSGRHTKKGAFLTFLSLLLDFSDSELSKIVSFWCTLKKVTFYKKFG